MQDTRQSEASIVSEIELVRLVGFFAGEGNISLMQTKQNVPVMYVALGNSELYWVQQFHQIFGGSMYTEKPKYAGAKNIFRWRASGKAAASFLETIQPYLVGEKADQLKIALLFQRAKVEHNSGRVITKDLKEITDKLILSMKELRRAAAETNRKDAAPRRNDSPILQETGENSPDAVWGNDTNS